MNDPLAGRREEINEGLAYSLMWRDTDDGCPVEVGQVIELRSCRIQITKTHRIQKDRKWWWRAEFRRYVKGQRPQFLDRRGGLTTDRKQAMAAQDDEDPGTLRVIREDERDLVAAVAHAGLGEQPEPEAVPDHEIADYNGSREARQQYALDMAERRVVEESIPLSERIRRLEECVDVDLSRQFARIEQGVKAAETKWRRLATTTKVPSDRGA